MGSGNFLQVVAKNFDVLALPLVTLVYPLQMKFPEMITMKHSVFLLLVTCSALLSSLPTSMAVDNLLNVSRLNMFVDELLDMPRLKGYNMVSGVPTPNYITIGMFKKTWKFHRDLPPTPVFAFGQTLEQATVPGPTIEAMFKIDTYVKWENHIYTGHILPFDTTIPIAIPQAKDRVPTVVHLHGGIHEPESDGHANAWFTADFKERGPYWHNEIIRYNNNQQPGNLWYHDHAKGWTRVNLLAGLVGSYIIRQPEVEDPLGLPSGDEFDRPLVIFDRSFNVDGSIFLNSTGKYPNVHPQWQPEYFGDAIIVNGKAWPYMTVRRRKYRFRIINASNARHFNFYFTNGLDFIIVGTDTAYIEKPVVTKSFLLVPSAIIDVIVDFSRTDDNQVILANNAAYPYPTGVPVNDANGNVMKFVINPDPETETGNVPNSLIQYISPDTDHVTKTRYITFYEEDVTATGQPTHAYLINGQLFDAAVTETAIEGSSEVWYIINLTEENHPLHIHLGLFQVLEQVELASYEEFQACMVKNFDALKCNVDKYLHGNAREVPTYEKGWKNVYGIMPHYAVKILVRFAYIHTNASYNFDPTPEPGYVYHCHILDHEDNVMMRPLKIIKP